MKHDQGTHVFMIIMIIMSTIIIIIIIIIATIMKPFSSFIPLGYHEGWDLTQLNFFPASAGELRPGQVALCFQRCPKSLGGAPNSPRNPENAWDTSNLSSKNTLNQHSLCVFLCFLMKYMGISRYIPCGRYGISKSASNFSPTNRSWEGKTGNMAGFHPVLALLQRFHGGVAAKHRDRR